jgi:hypothetical protein
MKFGLVIPINNHLTENDFSGTFRDLQGDLVSNGD